MWDKISADGLERLKFDGLPADFVLEKAKIRELADKTLEVLHTLEITKSSEDWEYTREAQDSIVALITAIVNPLDLSEKKEPIKSILMYETGLDKQAGEQIMTQFATSELKNVEVIMFRGNRDWFNGTSTAFDSLITFIENQGEGLKNVDVTNCDISDARLAQVRAAIQNPDI